MNNSDLRAALQGRLFRLPRWAAPFALAGAVVVGLLMVLLAASLALIIIPLVMAGGAFAAWRIRRQFKRNGGMQAQWSRNNRQQPTAQDVIDVEYRIVETTSKTDRNLHN